MLSSVIHRALRETVASQLISRTTTADICTRSASDFNAVAWMVQRAAFGMCAGVAQHMRYSSGGSGSSMEMGRDGSVTRNEGAVSGGSSLEMDAGGSVSRNEADDAAQAGGAAEESSSTGLVVIGGNGFVGRHVCQVAVDMGLPVTSISRSGRPPSGVGEWAQSVEWVSGDALHCEEWSQRVLPGSIAVISCLGLLSTSQSQMLKVNGEANVNVINAAAAAGVPRYVYVSAHSYGGALDAVLHGYFRGKREAEDALLREFPSTGVILRPGFIHGTRMVGSLPLRLDLIGSPMEKVLSFFPTEQLANIPLAGAAFVPPVSVQSVARCAVTAATDPSVAPGILKVWDIKKY